MVDNRQTPITPRAADGDPVRQSYGSRRLNTSTDVVASTFMAERRFQVGIVRGKNEYLYGVEILPMFRNYDYEVMIGPGSLHARLIL